MSNSTPPFDPRTIDRPDRTLLTYYLLTSLLAGPFLPLAFIPLWIRYATLRYRFDDEGISACWGVLFRREIYLTYKRIQDIHLTRNVIQRYMHLATISVQTASGKSEAELTIEGILQADQLRDHLYSKMRGARDAAAGRTASTEAADATYDRASQDQTTQVLSEIRDALQTLVSEKQRQRDIAGGDQ